MAVYYGPEGADAAGQHIISHGGNIYTLSGYVKTGNATRGRGFWTGAKRADEENPDVDEPKRENASTLIVPDDEDDGFDDDVNPFLAVKLEAKRIRPVVEAQRKQARRQAEAMFGTAEKAVLTIGGLQVDLLLKNPESMTEEELIKGSDGIQKMLSEAENSYEQNIYAEYAGRLARAIRGVLNAKDTIARSILTKEKDVDKKDVKPAKPTKKSSEVKTNDKGKTAYKYPKKNGGKGSNSDGGPKDKLKQSAPQQNGAQSEDQPKEDPNQISQPQEVNEANFCMALGLAPAQLANFASKKTKQQFVDFFMGKEDLVKKYHLQAPYVSKVYDKLVGPKDQPGQMNAGKESTPTIPQKQAVAARKPALKTPGQMAIDQSMKSIVVFSGATLNPKTLSILDMLKSHRAETADDIRVCLRDFFACTDDMSYNLVRRALREWESDGLISIYPEKI